MKKSIRIKFTGFWSDFDDEHNFFTEILEKYFNVIISDNPEYIFCSVLGQPYEECRYDCVRVHYNGENFTPDFNIHDYSISYDELNFGDRHLQYPLYLVYYDHLKPAMEKHLDIDNSILNSKIYFCNYIYGANREYRQKAFDIFNFIVVR